jgi:hypothetical protein
LEPTIKEVSKVDMNFNKVEGFLVASYQKEDEAKLHPIEMVKRTFTTVQAELKVELSLKTVKTTLI